MNASPLTAPKPISSIAMFRRWLLRIHGTILTLVALGSALATTIGWMTGTGLFGFMQQNPMVWVGALAHCAPLIAALGSLAVFESMGAFGIVRIAIAFYLVWLCLETFAAVYPDPSH